MSKFKQTGVLILILAMVSMVAVTVKAKTERQLASELIVVLEDSGESMEDFSNDIISYNTLVSDFNDYAARARFIYQDSLEVSNNSQFIKVTAGTTIVMDLYMEAFNEDSVEKLKLATKMLDNVLLPLTEDL